MRPTHLYVMCAGAVEEVLYMSDPQPHNPSKNKSHNNNKQVSTFWSSSVASGSLLQHFHFSFDQIINIVYNILFRLSTFSPLYLLSVILITLCKYCTVSHLLLLSYYRCVD